MQVLIKSYSRCEVKVIDLGSSCFVTDHLSGASYVQSRSYRAPEVIVGLPYDQKIDVWSLGCILAELVSARVLLQVRIGKLSTHLIIWFKFDLAGILFGHCAIDFLRAGTSLSPWQLSCAN